MAVQTFEPPVPGRTVRPSEIAKWLGVHPDAVRRAVDKGDIPATLTPGGRRRIAWNDAIAYLESRKVSA